MTFNQIAPASPVFEDAFGAFAHGTLISTTSGPVAVEDLDPGMKLETVGAGPQTLLWVGSMMVYPSMPDLDEDEARLTRITSETFGMGRPLPDLLLGHRARILFRHGRCLEAVGAPAAFAPASGFVDGDQVLRVAPPTPVRVYHLGLYGQHILRANGVEVESFHPGLQPEMMMDRETFLLFLSLFPHVKTPEDFGPMPTPRLTAFELDGMRAA